MPDMRNRGLLFELVRSIGETVTIFTTSGGESGRGFTGVLISVNRDFIRLLSDIGPAPGCALGSCCDHKRRGRNDFEDEVFEDERNDRNQRNRINCGLRNTGAVVDIPVNRIAAFVHNAI